MVHHVGVVGASGYGGVELLRLLAAHPGLQVAVVAAHSQAGTAVHDLFPNLADAGVFRPTDVDELADLDLVFLSTPHGPSIELGSQLADRGVRTVDLSGGFRLDAEAFERWYGDVHPRPDLLPDGTSERRAVYGLTEFARTAVAGATLVANPGCYVITTLLGLVPLASVIVPGSVVVDGKSGVSGAGRALSDRLHFSNVDGSVTAYGAPDHRHTGEIEQHLDVHGRDLGAISFTPHLIPIARGMLVTAYGQLEHGVDGDDVQDLLTDTYRDEPFVTVLDPGRFPVTKAVAGSNGCQLSAFVDPRTRRVVVVAVTDNLGKGAAGGAIQNANLMLGLDETSGLSAIGVYP